MFQAKISRYFIFAICLLAVAVFTACGSSGGQDGATEVPAPTIIPTHNFVQPTEAPAIMTMVAATETASAVSGSTTVGLDPEKVAKGRDRYTTLGCNVCHGDAGEGVTDKGSDLRNLTMSQDDFIILMRSGGKLGSAHQFSTNRLSDTGGKNLYEYLKSLVTP